MSLVNVLVHGDGACSCRKCIPCLCYMSMSMSLRNVHVYTCCMSMSMLHVHEHDTCPLSMLLVHFRKQITTKLLRFVPLTKCFP
jgi:hypothetical protein